MEFFDALYGKIEVAISHAILAIPELQRLREVRLCNVNSPYITGGSNLNRFEHAIGTAHLAEKFCKKNEVNETDKKNFIIAALLHDMVTPPFGHSLEYLFEAIGKCVYEHAQLDTLFKGKTVQSSRLYYMNKKSTLLSRNDLIDIESVKNIILGNTPLSKYLINDIDLDNIDNVFRFAYHIGIKFKGSTPVELSEKINYRAGSLVFSDDNVELFKEWYLVRKQLYKLLLENHGEFVAKALLERVLIELIKEDALNEYDWILVDFDLVQKALRDGNSVAKQCIQNYMLMDFPKHYEIYYIKDYKKIDALLAENKIQIIDEAFDRNVFLHFIRDVNKTQRPVKGVYIDPNTNQKKMKTIGRRNDRYLVGFFSDKLSSISFTRKQFEEIINEKLLRLNKDEKNEKKQLSLF